MAVTRGYGEMNGGWSSRAGSSSPSQGESRPVRHTGGLIRTALVLATVGALSMSTTTRSASAPSTAAPAGAAEELGAILPSSMLEPATSPDDMPITWTGAVPGGAGLGNVPLSMFAGSTLLDDVAIEVGLDPETLTGDRGLAGDGETAAFSVTAVTDPSGDARRLVSVAPDVAFPNRSLPMDWDTVRLDGRDVLVLGEASNYLYATGPWAFQVTLHTGDDRLPMEAFLRQLPLDDLPAPTMPTARAVELGARLGRLRTDPAIIWSGNALVAPGDSLTPRPIMSVSPSVGVLEDVASELGIKIADVYGFAGGEPPPASTMTVIQAWVDPAGAGQAWINPLRAAITAPDLPFGTPYEDRGTQCIGDTPVTSLGRRDGGGTLWLFAAGPDVVVVSASSEAHGRATVEALVASAIRDAVVGPCASPHPPAASPLT